jgi:hypothetical protein
MNKLRLALSKAIEKSLSTFSLRQFLDCFPELRPNHDKTLAGFFEQFKANWKDAVMVSDRVLFPSFLRFKVL